MSDEVQVLLCTAPAAHADTLAATLVEERLAACVNLLPVRSVYRWEGRVEHAEEVLMILKAPRSQVAALRARLLDLHPYDLPEVLALSVDSEGSHRPYLDWVLGLQD
jgi:periplasmic divalent cation tolerance protein